jgi:hypothetical protein
MKMKSPGATTALGLSTLFFALTPIFSDDSPSCAPESMGLVSRAAHCFDHHDYGCAKLALEQTLRRQPGCAQAMHLESFLLERDGKKEEAAAMRQEAQRIDPSLKEFWEKRGHFIENEMMTTQEFSHFIVKFSGGDDRDNAWKAVQNLDSGYNFMVSRFGEEPPHKIEVIVYTGQEFVDAWRAPFIGGFFDRRDGKVRVRIDSIAGGEEIFRVICRHEFTHAFMYQMYAKELPLWFVEGVAEFYGYFDTSDSFWKDNRLEKIRKTVRPYPAPTLAKMSDSIKKKNNLLDMYLGYQYGQALVMVVAKERGDSWVPSCLTQLRAGKTFDEAFQEVVGITPDRAMEQLQKSWE